MNTIEALEHFNNFVVFCCSDRLAAEKAVLGYGSPCYARCLAWRDGREGLVFSEEGEEVDVVVCGVGAASKVGR